MRRRHLVHLTTRGFVHLIFFSSEDENFLFDTKTLLLILCSVSLIFSFLSLGMSKTFISLFRLIIFLQFS